VYTPAERERLRDSLLEAARADERISGAALTGSAASGSEDAWSDIDLFFGLVEGAGLQAVVADWSDRMYRDHGALHHLDVVAGPATYRVFLLAGTLQVDLAFAPASDFGASASTFKLVFGTAVERTPAQPPSAASLAGLGWLYALHARSCIQRGKVWQAEHMVSGVRDHALALACLRHQLPAVQGRGLDRLPAEVRSAAEPALVRSLDEAELKRAFRAAVGLLLGEIREADEALAGRLERPLWELCA
jgi:predicted nucleotidyltransferase